MARKLKIMENEKNPFEDLKNVEITVNVKYEKCTLQDLEYGEKNENHGKCKGKLKKLENLEMSTVGRGIWQEN